ncbi:YjdJ family protein [Neobacillus drentensis]|uniref:YjdJ family protein n=1 Tax=Neobacillus drentensis TaxID=220684 RepID=UPI002FFDE330
MIFWSILGLAILVLCFSTVLAWYEGSNIVDDSFEWKYTAKFTTYFNGDVSDYHDINQLDYFIYAAKFHPFFPILMLVSGSVIIVLIMFKLGMFRRFVTIFRR